MPFIAPDADDQFVGELVQFHIVLGDKWEFQRQVVMAVFLAQIVGFFFKKPLYRILSAVYLIG